MTKLSVAEIFSKGMVLQRQKPIVIYGKAEKGDRISVSIYNYHGALKDEIFTVAQDDECWKATLEAMEASIDNKIVVENTSSQETIVIEKVSVGEVWLAGGQSNMEFFNKYDQDWDKTKKLPVNDKIHFYNVPQRAFEGHVNHNGPGRDGYGIWLSDHEKGYENFSAIGYIFARKIQEKLNVPVGIIGCNWGGTTASAWVPKSVLEPAPLNQYLKEYDEAVNSIDKQELKAKSLKAWEEIDAPEGYKEFERFIYGEDRKTQLEYMMSQEGAPAEVPMGPYNENRPCGLYETMLEKVIPYSIKGALWYQGESDAGDRAKYYDLLLKGLIDSWRSAWNDDFPFIVAQLAPFKEWLACTNDGYCLVREQQQKVADTVKDVYLTSIMDIGNYYDIHPKEKVEVGRRMSLIALKHVYDAAGNVNADNPRVKTTAKNEKEIVIEMDNADNLSISGDTTLSVNVDGKTIAPESVDVTANKVVIKMSDDILNANSINVSMGWDDYAIINIKNEQGLPIAPFTVAI